MAMQSDFEASDNSGWPARCSRCSDHLGNWPTREEAGAKELNHQMQKHKVTFEEAQERIAADQKKSGRPAKLTRLQKQGKYPKPGTRKNK